HAYRADPASSHFERPLPGTTVHVPALRNCAVKRMYMRRREPSPGIRARTPISFGDFGVSHTFTVAHRFLTRRASAPAGAAAMKQIAASTATFGGNLIWASTRLLAVGCGIKLGLRRDGAGFTP